MSKAVKEALANQKRKANIKPGKKRQLAATADKLWFKCDDCGAISLKSDVRKNLYVCPHCQHHAWWPIRKRLETLVDESTFTERLADLVPVDILKFSDSKAYSDRLASSKKATKENDAFVTGTATIGGHRVAIGGFSFDFMGGSMGAVVGEKIADLFECGLRESCSVVLFSASGGARMHEGIVSLMQMAKTSAAVSRFRESGMPYISVLLNPTTGGVAASFAWLGDVMLAERNALVGFAGPRVIEQTIRQKLPEGFQRPEFLISHGMIDAIVERKDLRATLQKVLGLLAKN